jgi:hypothetical protein
MPRFHLASLGFAKDKAKLLRSTLSDEGHDVSLGRCQDALACLYGYRDWSELTAVTRSRSHPKSGPDEVAFDPDILSVKLGVHGDVSIRIVDAVKPGEISRAPMSDHDAWTAAWNLLTLSDHVGYAIEKGMRDGITRFLISREKKVGRNGVRTLSADDILQDARTLKYGLEPHSYVTSIRPGQAMDEIWNSLLRKDASRRVELDDPFEFRESFLKAMDLPRDLPERITFPMEIMRDDVAFDVRRTAHGIEIGLSAGPPVLATIGIELSSELEDALSSGGFLVVIGKRQALTEIMRRRLASHRARHPRVMTDPDDELLRIAVTDHSDGRIRVVSLPEANARDAMARILSVAPEGHGVGDRSLYIVHVGQRTSADGRDPCTVTYATNWQARKEPRGIPRPLLMQPLEAIGMSSKAAEAVHDLALGNGSIMVCGDHAPELLSTIANLRVTHSPASAASTVNVGNVGGHSYYDPLDLEWIPTWQGSEILGHGGSSRGGIHGGFSYAVMKKLAQLPVENLKVLRERNIAFVSCESFGRPCRHCSHGYGEAWVFGSGRERLRHALGEDAMGSVRFRSPFGCSECRNTGYLGTLTVTDVLVPSFEGYEEIRHRDAGYPELPVDFGCIVDPVEDIDPVTPILHLDSDTDGRSRLFGGEIDPVDWFSSGSSRSESVMDLSNDLEGFA